MKCKCAVEIPQGRLDLGYKTCIKCARTERYACVPITNHKTGNTIQIVSQELADAMYKAGRRKGYGTCLR